MKKYENLFYLIQSLNKSEKRYFKIEANTEENAYIQLFDAIEEQKTYDEAQIKSQFQDAGFVRQLSTMKNYLLNKILRSLRNFHSEQSVNFKLLTSLQNIEILYNKGLYELCSSEIKRAEKQAANFQNHFLQVQLVDWKRRVHQALHPSDRAGILAYVKAQQDLLQTSNEYLELLRANIHPEQFSIVHKKSDTLQNTTLRELLSYQKSLSNHDPVMARNTLENLIKKWDARPELIREYLAMYLSVNNNYLAFLIYEKKYQEALQHMEALKKRLPETRYETAIVVKETLRRINTELEIYRDAGMLAEGKAFIPEVQAFVEQHRAIVPPSYWLSFRFQFAYIHFLLKDFDSALHWINDILNTSTPREREENELIKNTHWLNLLVHFELGNHFAFRYMIDGMKRFLQKQKSEEAYEQLLLRSLAHISGLPSKREQKTAFIELYEKLVRTKFPPRVLRMVDFVGWVRGKI
ncbi:MAG: hypothetical protein R2792_02460 [Saprospiraceae bacterium]